MSLDDKQGAFMRYLLSLAREGQEDRGALADLRTGLGKEYGKMSRVHKHVVPFLPESRHEECWYYLVATLFGSYPKHRSGRSLGAAFRPLRAKSDTMEARFVALLNAHLDDIGHNLRHVISLLKANEQPLDWFQLFHDVLHWDASDGCVQLQWARDFYKDSSKANTRHERKETVSNE